MTYSFLSFLGTVSYRIRILMYLDVSFMYLDCILMCPVHIHQDTSRYIKIHQDTFVSCCLWHFSCILPRGMYPPSKIHLGYISDTMYLVFQIHDTQDTFKIHSGYIWDTSRYTSRDIKIRVSRMSSPTCRAALGYPQTPEIRVPHVSPMYSACILHVSRMYLDYL